MKHSIWMAAAVAVLALSPLAQAEEFPGGMVCRSGPLNGSQGYVNDMNFVGDANQTQVYCPLKRITCSSFPCTKTAVITAMDNNSLTTADASVSCRLITYLKGGAYYATQGSWSTLSATAGTHGTLSLSVTMSSFSPNDGYLVAECLLGKQDGAGNRSDISWVSAND